MRPLARSYKGHSLPATTADVTTQFTYQGRTITVRGWRDVVRSDQKVVTDQATFTIWVYADPLYQAPFVLGTNLTASPATIFNCIWTAGRSKKCRWCANNSWACNASSCLPTWRASGSPNWASLPPTSWRIWRRSYPPSPPASGIANRGAHARPLAAPCWGRLVFRPHTPWLAEFAKNRP